MYRFYYSVIHKSILKRGKFSINAFENWSQNSNHISDGDSFHFYNCCKSVCKSDAFNKLPSISINFPRIFAHFNILFHLPFHQKPTSTIALDLASNVNFSCPISFQSTNFLIWNLHMKTLNYHPINILTSYYFHPIFSLQYIIYKKKLLVASVQCAGKKGIRHMEQRRYALMPFDFSLNLSHCKLAVINFFISELENMRFLYLMWH